MANNSNNAIGSDCITKTRTEAPCPDCGALECLCRPRFFAGQLLTEQDMNRLDQYIKKKNRLQNRNLHGWGVVNGLMVLCDPCEQIKVTKGYALSPCGDDIVVCEDTAVDICALIRKCKEKERKDWECQPFHRPPTSDCEDLEEEWVLTIRYCERPTRGITALRNAGSTCGKPPTGCTSSGGSTPSNSSNNSAQNNQRRGAPAECEPTIVCEGYAFDVFRKPEPEEPSDEQDDDAFRFEGPLYDRFMCCWNALVAAVPTPPSEDFAGNPTAWQMWCCQLRENLMTLFRSQPSTNCVFLETLACITCPNPKDANFANQMEESLNALALVLIEALFDCICLALLPPAPEATHDPRVPLAVVRVRARDCKIISVCNWTIHRKLLITWPTIAYWSSLIPIGKWLHAALEQICCTIYARPNCQEPADGQAGRYAANVSNASNVAMMRMNPTFSHANEIGAFMNMASLSAARGAEPLDPWSFLNSVTRLKFVTDAPGLEKIERRNIPQFLLMNTVARPMGMAALKPETLANFMKAFGLPGEEERAELIRRVEALEEKLEDLNATLERS